MRDLVQLIAPIPRHHLPARQHPEVAAGVKPVFRVCGAGQLAAVASLRHRHALGITLPGCGDVLHLHQVGARIVLIVPGVIAPAMGIRAHEHGRR